MSTMEQLKHVSQLILVLYLVVALAILIKSKYKASPLNIFLGFFFVYSFSYVAFINLDLANSSLGFPDLERAMYSNFGIVSGRAIYDAFFTNLYFILAFVLGALTVNSIETSGPAKNLEIKAFEIPSFLLFMLTVSMFLVWLFLFLKVFGNALMSGIGAYAAKAAAKENAEMFASGTELKLLKGFYSLWVSSTIGGLVHSVLFKKKTMFFFISFVLTVFAAALMGDRSQMFTGVIAVIAMYEVLNRGTISKAKQKSLAIFLPIVVLVVNATITFYRSSATIAVLGLDWKYAFSLPRVLGNAVFSAESWAPFGGLALLYTYDVPSLKGATFGDIALSFVPRFLMPSRSAAGLSYSYYSYQTGINEIHRGFGMHFVADAYMNGGLLLVVVLGLLLGGGICKISKTISRGRFSVASLIVYITLAGFIPNFLRSGMGSIRSYMVEFLFIPLVILYVLPFLMGRKPSFVTRKSGH